MNSTIKKFVLSKRIYNGSDLVDLNEVSPIHGNVSSLNLLFIPKSEKIFEPGVYAIFFDDLLIYIGKYQGTSKDPFEGCVNRSRWSNHLATITLRGKKVSCSESSLARLKKDLQKDHELKDKFNKVFSQFNQDVFIGDRGCVTVYPRMRFALEKWSLFEKLTHEDLTRFKFYYTSFAYDPKISTKIYRLAITDLEGQLINHFNPLLNVKGKNPSKTKVITINRYSEYLMNIEGTHESDKKVTKPTEQKKSNYKYHNSVHEETNLDLFFNCIEDKGVSSLFIDELISYLDSDTSLNYYFTNVPDFRVSGIAGKYKNGNLINRVLLTIKIRKIKKELKVNILSPIKYLDKSLISFSRTVNDVLPTEVTIPFSELNKNSESLVKILIGVQNYIDSKG